MGGRGGAPPRNVLAGLVQVPAVDANAVADMDIRDAYQDALNTQGRDFGRWVTLLQLRTALNVRGWSRDRQDEQLRRFYKEGRGILIPEEDQKTLTRPVREASLNFLGEIMHLFRIER